MIRRLVLILALFASATAKAAACAVCTAADSDSPWVDAANKGVIVMIAFVAFVLTGIASLAGFWIVRARRLPPEPADPFDS